MRILICRLSIIFLLFSCQKQQDSLNYHEQVRQLNTVEVQQLFLEEIYDLDQKVRKDNIKIEEQYEYDSPEVKGSRDQMINTDKENLAKIANCC